MYEAKIFKNGQSQAVRLPKEYRFDEDSVFINRIGQAVFLIPKNDPWRSLVDACGQIGDDFMNERIQPPTQEREAFS